MKYLIDGYNVIKFDGRFEGRGLQESRQNLLEFISQRKPQGKNPVCVVFDFRSDNPVFGGGKEHYANIEIIFTDGRKSADDEIAAIIDASEKPHEFTTVTNDKGIIRRTPGAKHISVKDFLDKASKDGNKTPAASKSADKDEISEEFKKMWLK